MSQVSWPHLLPLSLRLNVAKAVLEQGKTLPVLMGDKQIVRVIKRVYGLSLSEASEFSDEFRKPDDAGNGVGDDGATAPLETYLSAVGAALSAKASTHTSIEAKGLITSLSKKCSHTVCKACSAATKAPVVPVCQWTEDTQIADAQAMEDRGECIAPVREVFDFCKETSLNAYSGALGKAPTQSLILSTGHTIERNNQLELSVHGETREQARGSTTNREVWVSFLVEEFDVADYLSLLSLLFHECFVHGYCGVNLVGGKSDDSKAFHEGWMDCIATKVLESTMQVSLPISPDHPVTRYAGEFLRQMERVRINRYNPDKKPTLGDVVDWHLGEDALNTLRGLLTRVMVDSETPAHELAATVSAQLVSLSIVINASDLSHTMRARLVESLTTNYSFNNEADRARAIAERPQVLDVLAKYIETGDALSLVRHLVAIH